LPISYWINFPIIIQQERIPASLLNSSLIHELNRPVAGIKPLIEGKVAVAVPLGYTLISIVPTICNYKAIYGVHCHLPADTAVNALETYFMVTYV